jgi:hypothetical protein
MLAQLVEDLLHLERGEDGLDEDGRFDRALRDAELVLRQHESVVPEPRLEVALELRQVEVRPRLAVELLPCVVEDREPEVEERRRDRLAVEQHVPLGQMPPARAHDERRRLIVQPVALLARVELDRPPDRVTQVPLALDAVLPGRRARVLEIGHEHARARVEGVDHHLAVDRARDLDPPVAQVGRRRRDLPLALADVFRLGREVGQRAGVELSLARDPELEQLAPPRA